MRSERNRTPLSARWQRLLPVLILLWLLAGCSGRLDNDSIINTRNPVQAGELLQTDVDRMATLAMRNNLNSLYRLMHKLYQRNPREWRKNAQIDSVGIERQIQYAIEHNQDWPTLGGRRDVAALDYALSPAFHGDRVAAFTYAIGSMLVTAHGGHTEFYLTDSFNAQFIYNAARNLEKAAWMLGQRRDASGQPLLLSNEVSERTSNLSYAVEFGKMVARLDLLTHVLEERYRRMGANYAQSLFLLNFLPVQ
ncbi:hypothetical protein [Pseudomonas sp. 8Z]|uniref:hypothetical protein n=1 Tax=Pseudomonas sp. 8Z TaxID=2653166 RepID=UPI00135B2E95|nr:hypothetical protein [Pseudomonas sp. 8Z]